MFLAAISKHIILNKLADVVNILQVPRPAGVSQHQPHASHPEAEARAQHRSHNQRRPRAPKPET